MRDVIALDDEAGDGRPLLEQVVRSGTRVISRQPLTATRARAQELIAELPESLRNLDGANPYPLDISPRLEQLRLRTDV